MSRLRLLFAFAVVTMSPAWAEPGLSFTDDLRPLIRDGRFFGRLYIAREASSEDRASARYLADWIRRVTGAEVAVTEEGSQEKGPGIYVGATAAAAAAGVKAPYTISHDASTAAVRGGGRLFLVGESARATRFAVARFVRRELGVVFVMPGEFGAAWKSKRIVRLPEASREDIPAFAWRHLTGLGSDAERRWAADMGLGDVPDVNHALWQVFDRAAFEANPAMFPTRGGVRVAPSGRDGYEPQPNLANPDSALYAARRAADFFQKHPEAPAFSLSINDNMTWDDSPASKAVLGTAGFFRNRPDYSDYVFRFMNRAAEALRRTDGAAVHGRYLTAYAYYHCENTPSFRVDPAVFPVLTADRIEWRDSAFAAEDAALIARWARSGAERFGVYDYYYGEPIPAPRVFLRAEAESIRCAAAAGASLFFTELEPDWGFDGPKAWLAAELLWTPDADPARLLDRYFDAAYGPAAEPMRRFFAVAEACWTGCDLPPSWIRFFRDDAVCALFPVDVRRRLRGCLDDAARCFARATPFVAGDAAQREGMPMRLRTTSLSFAKFEALADRYDAAKALDALPVATTPEAVATIRDRLGDWLEADRRLREAAATWDACPLNPGGSTSPDLFSCTDALSLAAEKTGTGLRGGTDVFAAMAAVVQAAPEPGTVKVFDEPFEAASFRPAAPGTWAAAKGLTIPKAPWTATLFEGERTRFGLAAGQGLAGSGALIVGGGDLAKLKRRAPVRAGAMTGLRVRHRGAILPGVQVALVLNFLDASDTVIGGAATRAVPSRDGTAWRTLALARRAPAGTVAVEATLSVLGQTAEDVVLFDDLTLLTLPAQE